ncbi:MULTISPECIES: ParB/RepB/Spo0J family partition protein [unclassified Motilimonas]|uniref:ParB/RepB/Spo0J family partition protein n=1 Tax=Motilimonas TaxID=1914248 RepID=UPI001E3D8C54|nr:MULTISPECIES: ParB/RepB/Spo0J family partition protein [unclassified Motilimonas]MCE0559340.1 ParB/RepB/Spo0J family partition protein [Motilimonas sp. E26]MDO6525894.1 ParB/RepB/Spo0J family partition protein [Motilimonas sp. 1_MG-2023]
MTLPKKRGLGKGLDALLGTSTAARHAQVQADISRDNAQQRANETQGRLCDLPVAALHSGKYQPRKDMSPDALEELANSIRVQGVIQPIIVREMGDEQYEIIAGERRWRAAKQVGLTSVPCVVKDASDEAAVAIALIENIQREDLNAMEEAVALQRLMQEFELTHQEVATAVGKSRTTVTNLLRLNSLNDDVKILLEHGDLDMGHARALLGLTGELQSEIAQQVVAKGLTVRETEKLIKQQQAPVSEKPKKEADPALISIESKVSAFLGSQVSIKQGKKGSGKLVIDYQSVTELDDILGKFMPENG